jgi:alkanesulfonate monooxygenase SsuD/methylene tetrahydromethanopterin reductase-like flavin-dependent oxidoreductase (luciferase family)
MDIGIGLPTTIGGVDGKKLTEFARRAEDAGFSTLGVLDRIVYPNYEPLVALAAAAAVTQRIRLTTGILIAPYRVNAALLAKQAATVHHLSGGRLVLGMAVGSRDDDYEASGIPSAGRGERFDGMLAEIKSIWAGEKKGFAGGVGPDVSDNPPKLVIGGAVDAAFRRAAESDGWIAGGVPPDVFKQMREKLEAAWREAGRDGKPYAGSLAYFALGGNAEADAQEGVGGYYAWLGDYADQIVGAVAKDEDTVRGYVQAFEAAGCDELIFFPSSADPEQVDLLAGAALDAVLS